MVGLSTSQQMNLKPSTRTHPKVFKLTDSESCENLQLKAVLLHTRMHSHTLACVRGGGCDANVDGWLGRPAGGYETASGSEPVASERADVIPGRLIHRSSGGTCRISTPRARFLPVARACGRCGGTRSICHVGGKKWPRRKRRHVWPFVLVRLISCNLTHLSCTRQPGRMQP